MGETLEGKWYGGHYGWTFPHGFQFIADAMVVAGENERLLSGRDDSLTWVREQVEMLLSHAIEDASGHLLVPHKYADPDAVIEYAGNEPLTRPDRITDYPNFNRKRQVDGWFEFGSLDPVHMAHVYADSLASRDLEVIRRIRDPTRNTWDRVLPGVAHGKCLGGQNHAWLNYLAGAFSDYLSLIHI